MSLGAQQWEPSCGAGAGGGTVEIKQQAGFSLFIWPDCQRGDLSRTKFSARQINCSLTHDNVCVCFLYGESVEKRMSGTQFDVYYLAEVGYIVS